MAETTEQSSASVEAAGSAAPPGKTANSPPPAGAKAEDLRARLRASVLEALAPTPPSPAAEAEPEPPTADAGEESASPPEETDDTTEPIEETTDEDAADEGAESPKEKARLEEIRNLRSDRRALRDEVAELKEKLVQAEQAATTNAPSPAAQSPLANVKTLDQLRTIETQLKRRVHDIEDYLDESLDPDKLANFEDWARKSGYWDSAEDRPNAARLKKLKRLSEDILTEDVPARREFIQVEAQKSRQAEAAFLWWNDRSSEEYAMAQRALQKYPALGQFAEWKELVSLIVKGAQALGKELSANGGHQKAAGPARLRNPKLPTATVALPTAAARPALSDPATEFVKAVQSGNREEMKKALVATLNKAPLPAS
jgi:hypothetical protein